MPINDSCGPMFVLQGTPPSQWCANQAHDAKTPASWPYHHLGEAVAAYKAALVTDLPDLGDITLA